MLFNVFFHVMWTPLKHGYFFHFHKQSTKWETHSKDPKKWHYSQAVWFLYIHIQKKKNQASLVIRHAERQYTFDGCRASQNCVWQPVDRKKIARKIAVVQRGAPSSASCNYPGRNLLVHFLWLAVSSSGCTEPDTAFWVGSSAGSAAAVPVRALRTRKARMGDRSSPPSGGMMPRKMFRYGSHTVLHATTTSSESHPNQTVHLFREAKAFLLLHCRVSLRLLTKIMIVIAIIAS